MRPSAKWFGGILTALAVAAGMAVRGSAQETKPDNTGFAKLLTASWLGGPGDDELVAVAIAPDMTIVRLQGGQQDQRRLSHRFPERHAGKRDLAVRLDQQSPC